MLEALLIVALAIKMDGPLEEAPPSGGGHFDADDGGLEDAGGTSVVMHTWQRTNVASAPAGGGGSEGAPANMHYKGYCDASLKWCDTWTCNGEAWCNGNGKRPEPCSCCPGWCETWSCGGEQWCASTGKKPEACEGCCPKWCKDWRCNGEAWCHNNPNAHPEPCNACFPPSAPAAAKAATAPSDAGGGGGGGGGIVGDGRVTAEGPLPGISATAGWATDHGKAPRTIGRPFCWAAVLTTSFIVSRLGSACDAEE